MHFYFKLNKHFQKKYKARVSISLYLMILILGLVVG